MKANLKNRPEIISRPFSSKSWCNPEESAKWFEVFEKECRERIEELKKYIRKNKGDSFNNMRLTLIAQLKEILGENKP